MTQTMRSVSPKPTFFRRKEKEEKDTADVTSNKKADDGAFFASFSSSLEEEEEEVRHFAARFWNFSTTFILNRNLSQSLSPSREERYENTNKEKTFIKVFTLRVLTFLSLSYVWWIGEMWQTDSILRNRP